MLRRGINAGLDLAKSRKDLKRIKELQNGERRDSPGTSAVDGKGTELAYNTRSERLDHTFDPKHKLDGVVSKAGGRENAMREILDALRGRVPPDGRFVLVVSVRGEDVTVRGAVVGGEIKIGTAFIP